MNDAASGALLRGSMVAMVTPMRERGDMDWDALDELVEWHIAEGTHGLVAVGTTGESATLDMAEHDEVIARMVAGAAGRVPVIAGTGANSTEEALQLTAHAAEAGADACLLVTPYYNRPSQEGMYRHFKQIADAVDIAQILYDVPARTGVLLSVDTVQRLAGECGNIIALKDGTGDVARGQQLMHRCGDALQLLSGDDGTAAALLLCGAVGAITVTGNVAPRLMSELCVAATAGDALRARALDAQLRPLHSALFVESNPIPAKWALASMGRIGPTLRLPLCPLSARWHDVLREAMDFAGIALPPR